MGLVRFLTGGCGGRLSQRVPVVPAALAFLEEGPDERVDDVGLVLLQPVAGPGDDVEAEVTPDVEAALLRHVLLQEGVPLSPEQQNGTPDVPPPQGWRAGRKQATSTARLGDPPSVLVMS